MLNLRHGQRRRPQNLGYVFEIGGRRMLHMGDADGVTLSEFQAYELPEKQIDVLKRSDANS